MRKSRIKYYLVRHFVMVKEIYMKLSLIVPCYNEEENVQDFFREIEKTFYNKSFDYEFIFIDDGSKDNTLVNLKQLYSSNHSDIQILSFSRNFGKEAAIYAGLKYADGDLDRKSVV